ncbi:MAG: aldehyde dehydrogenase family protein, partial [Gammaproteobacteria bacterium]|nr:aldehyde dehydrogenase family protein [Gammaproteobacteria bacterium]
MLNNTELLKTAGYINGQWVGLDSNNRFEVKNAYTKEVICTLPDMGAKETNDAIEVANNSWLNWRNKTAKERALILKKWFDLIIDNQEDLAILMTAEQGKPLAEAKGEVVYGASFIEWFAEEGKRTYGDIIPTPANDRRILVIKQPIGVVAAITPWNFPIAMITRK